MEFIYQAIQEHISSEEYKTAVEADLYFRHLNPTIMAYEKFVYDRLGRKRKDIWSPNSKIASNWYFYFTMQAVQYLLGNGINFGNDETKVKLGKGFEKKVKDAAILAKNGAVSFGFWNKDRLEVFAFTEFVPLWDEITGDLMAGIYFSQIAEKKPLKIILFEADGCTHYIKRFDNEMEIYQEKRAYLFDEWRSKITGEVTFIDNQENYSSLPIIPFWNTNKLSDIVGNKNTIDAYDLMQSKLINNVSEGAFIYWVLKNCNAMESEDDAQFFEQLLTTHVVHANGDDGAGVESHQVDVPFEGNEQALLSLKEQLYKDFMALDVEKISSANVTATQIKAAYDSINLKTDDFEYQTTQFIEGILNLLGIDDTPTYTRAGNANASDEIDDILKSSDYLSEEYATQKILTLLGDIDRYEEVRTQKIAEESDRFIDAGE